jgi:outer membrane protein assembly factor BamD
MSSYASYKNRDFVKAEINLKRYISLYPASDQVSYAQYLLGMCHFDQIIDDKRDQTAVKKAYQTFKLILDRYPETAYAKDAYYKIIFLEDILASKELNVAKTYLSLKKYIAAIKRFKNIVNNYQTSSFVPESLHRLVEVYLILGVNEEAIINARVLGYNFPKSKWYKYSYKLLKNKNLIE